MKSTAKKIKQTEDNMIIAQGKRWSEESFVHYRKYQTEFVKKTYRTFTLRLRRTDEKDLIDWLESQDNLAEYLINLIKKDHDKKTKIKNKTKQSCFFIQSNYWHKQRIKNKKRY